MQAAHTPAQHASFARVGRSLTHVLAPHHSPSKDHFELKVDINEKKDVEHQMEHLCVLKSKLSPLRMALLGMLSGVWMVLAATFAGTLAAEFDSLQNLVVGAVAPVAMHFIVIFGGEFYSGNCMFFSVGMFKRKVTPLKVLSCLWWSFFWNFAGVFLCAWLLCYMTEVMRSEPQLGYVIRGAQAKVMPPNATLTSALAMMLSYSVPWWRDLAASAVGGANPRHVLHIV
jgi:formate/nitrite transporter FocA (FNT family)